MNTVARKWTPPIGWIFPALLFLVANGGAGQTVQHVRLDVEIAGVRAGQGPVSISLWRTADGFLKGRSYRHASVAPSADAVRAAFDDLEPGQYAVSAFQDKNNNRRLDTGFMGKPKEPYGFSNDARGSFGPPAFRDAAFEVTAGNKIVSFRLK